MANNRLWTRDFTIITIGSAVSMLGNSMTGFALSLFVLDFTDSTSLYAAFVFLYTLPQIAAPAIAGPLLDRFSRRKTIYGLDFLSAALYGLMSVFLILENLSFPLLICAAFLTGTINSVYLVAFNSFYPMLIADGMYDKAYSVSSTLETLSYVTLPIATLLYNAVGLAPLLCANSFCFFLAAVFETRISDVETARKLRQEKGYSFTGYIEDTMDGLRYLVSEKGLLCISMFYFFSSLAYGASSVITLPYFRAEWENGEFVYMFVYSFMFIGRIAGGAILYRQPVQRNNRYRMAILFGIFVAVEEGIYLYTNLFWMCGLCLMNGLAAMTNYNMRQSAVNSYIPDEKRGRFQGAWVPIITLGSLMGEAGAGIVLNILPMRETLTLFMASSACACTLFLGGGRKAVKPIYNAATDMHSHGRILEESKNTQRNPVHL